MSRVSLLAGALLAETGDEYFLVGNLKRPCDFAAAGFETPRLALDAGAPPYVKLRSQRAVTTSGPWLSLTIEGEALARLLSERLLIERNGSVSDRLWRLIVCPEPDGEAAADSVIEARWLAELPDHLWQLVRGTVLRCS